MTGFSQTFAAAHDRSKKSYNIHFVAELSIDDENDEIPTSKEVLRVFEETLAALDMTPIAGKCDAQDGDFTSEVWIDDEPVGFQELIDTWRREQDFMDREDGLEIFQRTDMRWDWRVLANNGNIIATSGNQGYENRGDAAQVAYSLLGPIPVSVTALHAASQPALWNGTGSLTLDVPAEVKGAEDE
jgi:uncharacterized protein YegP (UPF0339 family)